MDEQTPNDEVRICRKNERIIRVKIAHSKEILKIISAYAMQVGIHKLIKRKFREDLDDMV